MSDVRVAVADVGKAPVKTEDVDVDVWVVDDILMTEVVEAAKV